ncbi:hypothetical protein ACIQ1D_19335 [Lysinibacillus xylanilyticus]|uniref:hypothetical protein n=1 Tax=Lysinibacillus xylanilyticus TaxID=582475 RepID=UPI00380ED0C3
MAVIGGNLERKEIGLPIGVSGTHDSTEINKTTGFLQLMEVDTDGLGRPIFAEKGSWTSDIIDLGDKFHDFEKVFTTNTITSASSFAVLTRVSDNNKDWSDWVAIAEDGAIQSDTKQYIQVRIDLFAGFATDDFVIAKSDFEKNKYIEEKMVHDISSILPTLTSNTSSQLGFSFASSVYNDNHPSYGAWKVFDKSDSGYYNSKNGSITGFVGFYFNSKIKFSKYKVRSGYDAKSSPKSWVIQGSNNTTDGTNGTWKDLDKQTNQTWTAVNIDKIYDIQINDKYHAYRLYFTENNGNTSYTCLGELDFYSDRTYSLSIKRDYQYDMTFDKTWADTGSLHRKKITREEWVKIDKLNITAR